MTTKRNKEKLQPVHPGEILKEDFMDPLNLNSSQLAKALDIPANRISQILQGKRAMTVDTALRLNRYFKVSAEFWMNLQKNHDLEIGKDKLWQKIKHDVKPTPKVA
tara:strand:+ start:18962 stop:19279 length:318 start_codon:yes stop_codon:yes gene_type:complete